MKPVLRPLSSCGLTCAAALELRLNLRAALESQRNPRNCPQRPTRRTCSCGPAHPAHLFPAARPTLRTFLRPSL